MTYATKFSCKFHNGEICEILQHGCDMKCESYNCDLCINKGDKEICKECNGINIRKEEA